MSQSKTPRDKTLLETPSPGHYLELQRVLALGDFQQVDSSPWPIARVDRGNSRGWATLQEIDPRDVGLLDPAEIETAAGLMWELREELSDDDVDILDLLMAAWIRQARGPNDRIRVRIDDLLAARGLKRRKGGKGRGGFERKQRAGVLASLRRIESVWLDIDFRGEVLQSRPFVVTDRTGQRRLDGLMDVDAVLVVPGTVFAAFVQGEYRQTGQLFMRAVEYNTAKRQPEKRLTRLLAWHYRCAARCESWERFFRVVNLLREIGLEVEFRRPGRTRRRLETALTRITADGVADSWGYRDEDPPRGRGMTEKWLESVVRIDAPAAIRQSYRDLRTS